MMMVPIIDMAMRMSAVQMAAKAAALAAPPVLSCTFEILAVATQAMINAAKTRNKEAAQLNNTIKLIKGKRDGEGGRGLMRGSRMKGR